MDIFVRWIIRGPDGGLQRLDQELTCRPAGEGLDVAGVTGLVAALRLLPVPRSLPGTLVGVYVGLEPPPPQAPPWRPAQARNGAHREDANDAAQAPPLDAGGGNAAQGAGGGG